MIELLTPVRPEGFVVPCCRASWTIERLPKNARRKNIKMHIPVGPSHAAMSARVLACPPLHFRTSI